jgi:Fur family transcriptional regulator, peroxide stress response regulator
MSVSLKEVQRRLDALLAICRQSGVRATHQRLEVFREVAASEEHPDVETIYGRVRRRLPTISLDTVYRTLSLLEEKGLLRRLELFSGRTRFDANTGSHHHFICTVCGRVQDFYSEALDNLPLPRSLKSMGRVESAQVQVRGICLACAGRKVKGGGAK